MRPQHTAPPDEAAPLNPQEARQPAARTTPGGQPAAAPDPQAVLTPNKTPDREDQRPSASATPARPPQSGPAPDVYRVPLRPGEACAWSDLGLPFLPPPPTASDAPLPPMPGTPPPGDAQGPALPPEGGLPLSLLGPGMPEPTPQAPEASSEAEGAKAFFRELLLGGEHEQKPDKPLRQSLAETVAQLKNGRQSRAPAAAPDGMPPLPPQGNPSLFAAMDAPLHGLSPDDIQFANEVDAALARRPRFGARALSVSVAAMLLCLLVWAAFANVDEVTHAEGSVVGSQRTQTIQNLEGGILRAVQVHEGQIVEKGEVLAQLDNEMAESAYRDAVNKAMENSLAILRLEAELKGQQPVFPEDMAAWAAQLVGRQVDGDVLARARQITRDQTNAWNSRQEQLRAEIEVLRSQYVQRTHDVEEQTARKLQLDRSLALSMEQRDTAYALVQRHNFSKMEYLGLQQRVVELQGQIDALAAAIPKAQAAAEESQQRIASRQAEQAAAITEEINKRRQDLNSLRESLSAGRDRVTRTELRAPVRSTVKQIYITTVGGVVKPGEPIMDLVPLDDTLLVEARVRPQDVAFLRPGQEVMVKVSAYDFSIYGGLEGKLESISADTIEDKRGDHYYLVKVRTRKNAIAYHNQLLPIIPGMVVTADILIGKKTVLDYLLKPILKAKQNALRER